MVVAHMDVMRLDMGEYNSSLTCRFFMRCGTVRLGKSSARSSSSCVQFEPIVPYWVEP